MKLYESRKYVPRGKNTRKNGPWKNGPRKNGPGKLKNKKSWGERRASWCVCVCVCEMLGCDQSMKTQDLTTNLSGLL